MRNRHLTALATAVASAVLGAGMVLLAPAAQAAPVYPPAAPAISVSSTVVDPGTAVSVTGTGFQALSGVTVTWTGPGARGMASAALPFGTRAVTADASGSATTSITFNVAGMHTITMSGVDAAGAPVSLSATVQVTGAPAAAGELSHTGSPLVQYLLAALGLVLVGLAIVYFVRRHRAASVASAAAPVVTKPLEPTRS
jgi:LPXTG-motif cell wall-anchored protein